MNSSDKQTRNNLAGTSSRSNLLDALTHLANVQDNAASFERFARRWPVFACVLDYDPSDDFPKARGSDMTPEEGYKFFEQHGYYRTTYMGVSYGDSPSKMPPNVPGKFVITWQMREALREIWRGNSKKLTDVLLPSPVEAQYFPDPDYPWPPQLKLDWYRGEFVYIPRTEFDEAVYELFRRSHLAKFCANPDCPAPYFIAGRTTQQFCSEKCSGVLQRAHELRWWKEHGKEWRSSKRSRGKRGKR